MTTDPHPDPELPDEPVAPDTSPDEAAEVRRSAGLAAMDSALRRAGRTAASARPRWAAAGGYDPEDDDGDDGDVGDPEAVDETDRVPEPKGPGHAVMDRAAITQALKASGYDGSFDSLSGNEEARARALVQYREMNLWRRHLIGSPAMLARLDALDREQPNFAAATQLVRQAIHLSMASGLGLRTQSMLLLGQSGIGKSRYARALADSLETDVHTINGSTIPDMGSLTGYPPAWKGAGPGRIAKFLIASKTASPLVFVDELDKLDTFEDKKPSDKLLSLIEPDTACEYQDENLQVPMRADHAIVLFACNEVEELSEYFLNRVVCLAIKDIDPDQRDAVLETILAEVTGRIGLAVSLSDRAALGPLHGLPLRRCRIAFEIAVGRAVTHQRRFVTRDDLAAAVDLLGRPDGKSAIGFGLTSGR